MARSAVVPSLLSHQFRNAQHSCTLTHTHTQHRAAVLAVSPRSEAMGHPLAEKGSTAHPTARVCRVERSTTLHPRDGFLFLTTASIKKIHSRERYYFLFTGEREITSAGSCCCQKKMNLQAGRLLKSLKQESFLFSSDSRTT